MAVVLLLAALDNKDLYASNGKSPLGIVKTTPQEDSKDWDKWIKTVPGFIEALTENHGEPTSLYDYQYLSTDSLTLLIDTVLPLTLQAFIVRVCGTLSCLVSRWRFCFWVTILTTTFRTSRNISSIFFTVAIPGRSIAE